MKMCFLMAAAAAAAAFVAVFVLFSSASCVFRSTHTHILLAVFSHFFISLLFILHITFKLTEFCCHWCVAVTDFVAAAFACT